MDVTLDRLLAQLAAKETPELLALVAQGDLTPDAERLLFEELGRRGIRDRGAAALAASALDLAEPGADPGRGSGPRASGRWALRIALLAGVLLSLVIGPVTRACAPLVWRSADDRECQKAGFWYAKKDSTEVSIHCGSW